MLIYSHVHNYICIYIYICVCILAVPHLLNEDVLIDARLFFNSSLYITHHSEYITRALSTLQLSDFQIYSVICCYEFSRLVIVL